MFLKLFVLSFICTLCYGANFKLDYAFSHLIDGWLKLNVIPATWSDARLRCHAKGGVLASPLSLKLQNAVLEHVRQQVPVIFTGVHASFSKGDYFSIEGTPLLKLPITWAPGEPDNKQDSESCLAMLTNNGTMMDVKCSDPLPYVCFRRKTKQRETVSRCRTIDPEYQLDKRTGSCYKFHRWGQSWARAYMTCAVEGAHLAIVNSVVESNVLTELFAQNPNDVIIAKNNNAAFLGYQYWDIDWMTIHSKTMAETGFEFWYPGEPNNGTQPEGEFCVIMIRGGEFNDGSCRSSSPFICEKSLDSDN